MRISADERSDPLTSSDETRSTDQSLYRLFASTVIVAVLVLQAVASIRLTVGPLERSPYLWPFIDYPMYSQPRYEGDELPRHRVFGITEAGERIRITPEALDTDYWIFRDAFVFPFLHTPLRDDLAPGVELFESRRGVRLIEVQLEDHPLVLTREGWIEGWPTRVGAARREGPGEPWSWEVP